MAPNTASATAAPVWANLGAPRSSGAPHTRGRVARQAAAGFTELHEEESWARSKSIAAGGKYYYTRNDSTLVAFVVGAKFDASGSGGFKMIGAHTDSPVLKVKPVSAKTAHGCIQLGAEFYGGGLWHTWFDRDLSIAGRVIVEKSPGVFEPQLVKIDRPLLRVPSLCIHLQSGEERKAFAVNKESHLAPILAQKAAEGLGLATDGLDPRHPPELLGAVAEALGCEASAIKDVELSMYDTQPGATWGVNNEFLSVARLDNQIHCFTAMEALLNHSGNAALVEEDTDVAMIALFDHEEVGSQSTCGAGSPVVKEAIARVSGCFLQPADEELYSTVAQKSFLISADVAHAVHPNYAAKHEENHRVKLNGGTVIKTNSNQRYATNSISGFFCREIARQAGEPIQEFVVRQDCPCGTTIGPIVAGNTGVRTVDVGVASWSMHSIRETIGVKDIGNSVRIFESFFKNFRAIDSGMQSLNVCPVAL